jgi:hypothetical protein
MTASDAIKLILMAGAVGIAIFLARWGGPRFRDLLDLFLDQFGGGPRPPSHPLPSDDSALPKRREVRPSSSLRPSIRGVSIVK